MALLPFISDKKLEEFTEQVLLKATAAEVTAQANLYSNVIDPFSALFDAMRHNISLEDWLKQEKSRQIQKTLQNALGDFHQNILGAMPGWENAGRGGSYDVINSEKKIIAEIKNKHNTMNSSSAEAAYQKLANHLRYNQVGYTAYIVFIVPRTSEQFDVPWSPNQTTMALREDIRKIDGKSFYHLASAVPKSMELLYEALPLVISKIVGAPADKIKDSSEFDAIFARAYR